LAYYSIKIFTGQIKKIQLERWYDYRTTDWANYLEYPEFTLKQTQQLLAID